MNDIEAAEREAFAKYITSQEHIGFDAVVWRGIGGDPLGVLHEPEYSENSLRSEWAAWLARSALAHAARGEGEDIEERNRRWQFDAVKRALDTGEEPHAIRGYHDSYLNEYAMTLRRVAAAARNEKAYLALAHVTPPPATGEAKWPEIRDSGGRTDFALTPATGEAGTRGEVEVGAHAMDVAERCYYAIKGGAPYRDSIRAMAAIIEAERPLPEAREGGG